MSNVTVSVKVTKDTYRRIKKMAKDEGRFISDIITRSVLAREIASRGEENR